MRRWSWQFKVSPAADDGTDPERAVLPVILWVHKRDDSGVAYRIYWVSIGWWKWALHFRVLKRRERSDHA